MSLACTGGRLPDTLLHAIEESIQEDVPHRLEQLLANDIVSSEDINKKNFLHQAAWCGFGGCVKVLLSHGADPNRPHRKNGCTALHLAHFCKTTVTNPKATIDLLVKAGARINCRGDVRKCGIPAMEHAIQHQRLDAVNELIAHNAVISLKAVLLSVEIARADILDLLLVSGGNCGHKRSPIHYWGTAFQKCLSIKIKKPKIWYKTMFISLAEASVCSPCNTKSQSNISDEELELLSFDLHNTIHCTLSSLAGDHPDLSLNLFVYLLRNGYRPDADVIAFVDQTLHVDYKVEYQSTTPSLKDLCVRQLRSCLSRCGNIVYGLRRLKLPTRVENLVLLRYPM